MRPFWRVASGRGGSSAHLLEGSAPGYASSGEVSPRAPPWPEGSAWAPPLLQGLAGAFLHWACGLLTCQDGRGANGLTCSEKATQSPSSLTASSAKGQGPGPGSGCQATSGPRGPCTVNARSTCPPEGAAHRAQALLTPNAVAASGHQRAGEDQGPPSSQPIAPGLTSGPGWVCGSQMYFWVQNGVWAPDVGENPAMAFRVLP